MGQKQKGGNIFVNYAKWLNSGEKQKGGYIAKAKPWVNRPAKKMLKWF
jgi:hypothetical protein